MYVFLRVQFFQSDIVDVNGILQQLGALVHEQGESLGKFCMVTFIFYCSLNVVWMCDFSVSLHSV